MKYWIRKFSHAGRGLLEGGFQQSSFNLHLVSASVAIAGGIWFRFQPAESALLGLTIGLVLSLELVNTALESLSRAVTNQQNEQVRKALDIAAGAVLLASISALIVGGFLFVPKIWP